MDVEKNKESGFRQAFCPHKSYPRYIFSSLRHTLYIFALARNEDSTSFGISVLLKLIDCCEVMQLHDAFGKPSALFRTCSKVRPDVVLRAWLSPRPAMLPVISSFPQMECRASVILGDCIRSICGKPMSDERRLKFRRFSVTRVVSFVFEDDRASVLVCESSIFSSSGTSIPVPVIILSW